MVARRFGMVAGALLALAGLAPTAAEAQYYGRPYGGGYYGRQDAGWGRGYGYDRPYGYDRGYRGGRYRGRYRCDRGNGGTVIGAIAGGLLGNQVAGRGDRTTGALVGAGVGALAGRAIDRDC